MLYAVWAFALFVIAGCTGDSGGGISSQRGLLERRRVDARLSFSASWEPCLAASNAGGWCARQSETADVERLVQLSSMLATGKGPERQTEGRRWTAIVDLYAGANDSVALHRAVDQLERLSGEAPRDAMLMNDLAVATMLSADRVGGVRGYLKALDLVLNALRIDSTLNPALFNHALLLDRLHLRKSARLAWQRVAVSERNTQWKAEAERRAWSVSAENSSVSWPSLELGRAIDRVPQDSIRRLVVRSPQSAREFATRALSQWGAASAGGHSTRSAELRHIVDGIAQAMKVEGLDASLTLDTAAWSRCARSAKSLGAFNEAIAVHLAGGYDDAAVQLRIIADDLKRAGCATWRWAAFYLGSAELNRSQYDAAELVLAEALDSTSAHDVALRGKLYWARGVTQLRRGNYDDAVDLYTEAGQWLTLAKEDESLGGVSYLLTEALSFAGRSREASDEALVGLQRLAPFEKSGYLNNHLTTVNLIARQLDFPGASLSVADEVVLVARGLERPQTLAWALRNRARDLLRVQSPQAALADLREARAVAAAMKPGSGQDRVVADIDLVLADAWKTIQPDSAQHLLRQTVRVYRRLKLANHLPRALAQSGLLALAQGDSMGASVALDEALRLVETQGRRFESTEARASFAATADAVYDALIGLELARGNGEAALTILMRAQLAPWSSQIGSFRTDKQTLDRIARGFDTDMAMLAYVVLPQRMGVWIGDQRGWRFRDLPTRKDLDTLVAATVHGMQRERAVSLQRLMRLHAALIQPISDEIGEYTRLVIVPDRLLGAVPFAALRSDSSGRFLVEDFELSNLPAVALGHVRKQSWRNPDTVLVYAPVKSPQGYAPLPDAQREAQLVAELYSTTARTDPMQLTSLESTRRALLHFAGHAVNDLERPERSFLATGDTVRLTGAQISASNLRGVGLMILSACSTQGAAMNGRGWGNGLSISALAAGAGGVVSTLWEIADAPTKDFQMQLHAGMKAGMTPAAALRAAQRSAIGSRDSGADPFVWGAFVLSGY